MTPRPRKRNNKDLPSNLYASKSNGVTYYAYSNPVTGKKTGFGRDKKQAIVAAKQLNQVLIEKSDLAAKVIGADHPFSDYLELYRDELMPNRRINGFPLSKTTMTEQRRVIKHLIAELGHLDISKIKQQHVAAYLNMQTTAETHNKHRSLLITIFKHAISDGFMPANLAERILKRDIETSKRNRLSIEQYIAIYACASTAIKNAMELSLNSMQRREDIRAWRFDYEKDGHYYVIQSKTRKHGKAAFLRIPTSLPVTYSAAGHQTLSDIIRACRDQFVCPFVIHRKPEKIRPSAEKEHSMQLSGKEITNGFNKARELAGITIDNPPTFHELLGLGEYLREQQGWSIKQIQTLRGHTSEKMTLKYLEGHHWTTVDAPSLPVKK